MSRVRRKFQFLRLVASGGFGDVYLCKEIQESGIGRLVAVKLLKSHWRDSQEVVSRLRDEARLLALLRHKNIITVYFWTNSCCYGIPRCG
jgi:serine/threonine protein kinase